MQTKLDWIRVPRPNKASKRYGRPTFAKAAVCRSWEKNRGSVKLPKAFGSGKVLRCHQPATITGIRVGCKRKASTAAERPAHKKRPRWEGQPWEGISPRAQPNPSAFRKDRENPTAAHCHSATKICRPANKFGVQRWALALAFGSCTTQIPSSRLDDRRPKGALPQPWVCSAQWLAVPIRRLDLLGPNCSFC